MKEKSQILSLDLDKNKAEIERIKKLINKKKEEDKKEGLNKLDESEIDNSLIKQENKVKEEKIANNFPEIQIIQHQGEEKN